ncbi:hypothetical protein ScPMuIL_003172 [Solemya velum]
MAKAKEFITMYICGEMLMGVELSAGPICRWKFQPLARKVLWTVTVDQQKVVSFILSTCATIRNFAKLHWENDKENSTLTLSCRAPVGQIHQIRTCAIQLRNADDMANTAAHPQVSGEFVHILSNHETVLCEELRQQWLAGQYCDMLIRLKLGKTISVHSCVISAFSAKISNFLHGEKYKILSLLDFGHEACYCIIDSLYTGILRFKQEQITDILQVASYFELEDIEQFCHKNIENGSKTDFINVPVKEKLNDVHDDVKTIESLCTDSIENSTETCSKSDHESPEIENIGDVDVHKNVNETSLDMEVENHENDSENETKFCVSKELPVVSNANVKSSSERAQRMGTKYSLRKDKKGESCAVRRTETKYSLRRSVGVGPERGFLYKDWTSGESDPGGCEEEVEQAAEETKPSEGGSVDKVCVVTIKSIGSAPNKMYLTKSDLQKGKRKSGSAKRKAFTQIKRCHSSGSKVKKESSEGEGEVTPALTNTEGCDTDSVKNEIKQEEEEPMGMDTDSYSSCEDEEFEAYNSEGSKTTERQQSRSKLSKKRKIPCPMCPRKFSKKVNLDQHLKAHSEGLAHTCQLCHSSYARLCDFTRHVRSHDDGERFRCSYCNVVCENRQALIAHSQTEHDDDKPFKCTHADCTFATYKYYYLADHQLIHREEKSYVCPKCNKGFSQSGGLISHSRSCLQTKSYLCDLCGQTFNHLGSMKTHRRVHLGEKPYVCQQCESRFSDHRNLKRHMRIHENLFPYECEVCQKSFRHSNSLKAHMKQHNQPLEEAEALCSLSQLYKSFTESHDLQTDHDNDNVTSADSRHLTKKKTNETNSPLNLIKDPCDLDNTSREPTAGVPVVDDIGILSSRNESCDDQDQLFNQPVPSQNVVISRAKTKDFYTPSVPVREENGDLRSQLYGHSSAGPSETEGEKDIYRQVLSHQYSGEAERTSPTVQFYSQPVFSRNESRSEREQFYPSRSNLTETGIERGHYYSGLHHLAQNDQFLLQSRSMQQVDGDERGQFYGRPSACHTDEMGLLSAQIRSGAPANSQIEH